MLTLLAKSNPPETLIAHTQNCLEVAKSMYEVMPFLGEVAGEPGFFEHLFYAVALHDLGKAAIGFQQQLTEGKRWNYRHEILSAGFVNGLQLPRAAKQAIGLAILTHHKDLETLVREFPTFPETEPGYEYWRKRIAELSPNWGQVTEFQNLIPQWLPLPNCAFDPIASMDGLANGHRDFLRPYKNAFEDREFTRLHGRYGMLLRGLVIACDHLASAGKTEILSALDGIASLLCNEIEQKGKHFQGWRPFQVLASKTQDNLMLSAPTGSGKTEAALLWTERNENSTFGRRVFYVLPYTASINAMFNRLKTLIPEERIGLLHGKANYFLYQSLSDREYTADQRKLEARKLQDLTRKIYRPYKILTPFQLLKAFFGMRGFEMQFAEMSESLLIFDEIHAYDPHTTALILTMIRHLHQEYAARFCIMTATLPKFLKGMLIDGIGAVTEVEMSPDERDGFTRHRVNLFDGDLASAIPQIEERMERGEKVLIVCNTVRQAQTMFEQLRPVASNAALLHSRFILRDRERIEKSLGESELLVGTQAVEVSLDIDFDVLFSEPAPIDALIQRFGRVNRTRKKELADVFICTQGGEHDRYIYSAERVERTLTALRNVDVLLESRIQDLIDWVYEGGYNEKEQGDFNLAKSLFEQHLRNVVPFVEDASGREEFTGLFKSVEVVPSDYEEVFLEHLAAKEFYEAMAYITSISDGQFHKLKKDKGRLYERQGQVFVHVRYDSERGLLLDELGGNVL